MAKDGVRLLAWLQRLFYVLFAMQVVTMFGLMILAYTAGIEDQMPWTVQKIYLASILISVALALVFCEFITWLQKRNARKRRTLRLKLNGMAMAFTLRMALINMICIFLLGCTYYYNLRWLLPVYALMGMYYISTFPRAGKLRRAMRLSPKSAKELGL